MLERGPELLGQTAVGDEDKADHASLILLRRITPSGRQAAANAARTAAQMQYARWPIPWPQPSASERAARMRAGAEALTGIDG